MGLYRAVGRPVFFVLPPETAHRLAGSLLHLPLPWARIGAVRDDPTLAVDVAGIRLRNPVGLAAGFDKSCRFLPALGRLGFGYVVGGTITRAPRDGNPRPRVIRYAGSQAMVNAMGLPNRGAEDVGRSLQRSPRTCPRLISLADESVEDVVANLAAVEPFADGIELNASCPNVSWGRDRDTEEHLDALLREVVARKSTPLFVKLPPFTTAAGREAVLTLARIAQERGAEGVTCGNTRPVSDAHLSTGGGGLSGRPLHDGTVDAVREVHLATSGEMAVNACGGVFTAEDALACLEAGATTVQVFTGLVYEGPGIVRAVTDGLAAALRDRRTSVAALTAAA